MKVAFFGYNFFSSCLDVLLQHGHEVSQIFTGTEVEYTDTVLQWASQHKVPVFLDKPSDRVMNETLDSGVTLFFSAAYSWKVTHLNHVDKAINLHSTLLPHGRGPCPLPHILQFCPHIAGLTFHQLVNDIDKGDIILQKGIPPLAEESLDMYATRLYLEAPKLLSTLLTDFNAFYDSRTPQLKGSYLPDITDDDRRLNWHNNCNALNKQIKAFNILGVYITIENKCYLAHAGETMTYKHSYHPGHLIQDNQQKLVVAVTDGVILFPKHAITSI